MAESLAVLVQPVGACAKPQSGSEMASGKPNEVKIRVHDEVDIAVALYMPEGEGRFPVLLAPSPYRYDNNSLPATPQFL